MELKYVAGTVAPNTRPTPFLCLVAKMLQIQPDMSIVMTFIQNQDFKYLRCLGMFYLRMVGDSIDIYKILEPYYNDFRKIKYQRPDGVFQILHIDEFVDNLLHEERFLSMQLPRLVKRRVFEANDQLEPRISPLEDEFQEMCEKEELLGKAGTSSEFSDTDDELEAKYAGFGKMKLPGLDKKKKTSKKKKISKVSENFQDTDEENEAFLDPRQKKRRLNEQQDADMFGDQANLGGLLKNKDGETAAGPSLPPNYTSHLSSEEENGSGEEENDKVNNNITKISEPSNLVVENQKLQSGKKIGNYSTKLNVRITLYVGKM